MGSGVSQVTISKAKRKEQLAEVAEKAKKYADRISGDPKKCPMFPPISKYSGPAETISYVHGYIAGLVEATTGEPASKIEMAALRDEVMHYHSVRRMVLNIPQAKATVSVVPDCEF